MCVTICKTQNLYADVGSLRTCVGTCNSTGGYPFRDESTKKCVNFCPDDPYLFADSVLGSCVYNCTPGYYADSSVANKTCVINCYSPQYGDNSTGYGKCVSRCPDEPPLFGEIVSGLRMCV